MPETTSGEHGLRRQLPYAIELRAGTRESYHAREHERCSQNGRGPQCDEDQRGPGRPRSSRSVIGMPRSSGPLGLLPPERTQAHSQVGDLTVQSSVGFQFTSARGRMDRFRRFVQTTGSLADDRSLRGERRERDAPESASTAMTRCAVWPARSAIAAKNAAWRRDTIRKSLQVHPLARQAPRTRGSVTSSSLGSRACIVGLLPSDALPASPACRR